MILMLSLSTQLAFAQDSTVTGGDAAVAADASEFMPEGEYGADDASTEAKDVEAEKKEPVLSYEEQFWQ